MISKFTASNFELDFTGKGISIVEENHWFSDQFFTKYTFPIEFDINDELDIALSMITHVNSTRSNKTFPGYWQNFGKESEAVFIIERIQGRRCQGKIRFGFEEFPNFDKKLSELNLERFALTEAINTFAVGRLDKTYPEVNFNFPQLFVDAFDTSSTQWQYFEGALNNYRSGAFLVNEYNSETGEQINRNIIQPVPYLLYVIAQGFADAGIELRGEILEDPDFKDAVITIISDYYSTASGEGLELYLQANEYSYLETIRASGPSGRRYDRDVGHYDASILLQSPGVYKIAGNVMVRTDGFDAKASLNVNGTNTIWEGKNSYSSYREQFFSIDRNVEVSLAQGLVALNFISFQLPYAEIDQNQDPEAIVVDLTITKIAGYDQDGNLVPTLVSPGDINLQKCVPDITFGEVIKIIKNWKNYDVTFGEGFVELNKIQNKMNTAEVIDLSRFQVREPVRKFYQDASFILQLQDVNSEEYKFDKVFVDANGFRTASFSKREDTSEITINGIPLPLKQKGDVHTAHLFTDDKSKLILSRYSGLTNGVNTCLDTNNLLMPAVYVNDYSDWLDFRIFAEGFEWTIIIDPELAGEITDKTQIYAYCRKFINKRVTKKNTSRNFWEITLEMDGRD